MKPYNITMGIIYAFVTIVIVVKMWRRDMRLDTVWVAVSGLEAAMREVSR